ncbi:SGNH/GDSL hydrolase family protein [Aureimonas sp. AU22]|uniref:SGNH/GDSL hydrolase family protein n=1 Tax=Aureimonas sp. AU22 TaxID=1638162 RepID=UPI0007057E7C|nr:SGNH/GDSL hydrolase family protein [Aureimonas sp. AU22]BAT30022.1 probable arylesterase protein [Aureimonas sp. AU22]
MKTVLCFGDSLTWGYDAAGPGRHRYEDRWPSVVGERLAGRARVIAEGLNGRTTAYDDHLAPSDRNGARLLPTILATHEPVDILVIALGSNDLKKHTGGGRVAEAAFGVERLVEIARSFPSSFAFRVGEIVLVSPPALVRTADPDFDAMFGHSVDESHRFKDAYARVAEVTGCRHVAASDHCVATPQDGVHLDAANTRALGEAIAQTLVPLL